MKKAIPELSLSIEKRKLFKSGTYLASIPADVICDNFRPFVTINEPVVIGNIFEYIHCMFYFA